MNDRDIFSEGGDHERAHGHGDRDSETLMVTLPASGEHVAVQVDRDTAALAGKQAWCWLAGHVLALDPDDCFDEAVALVDLARPHSGAVPRWPGTDLRRAALNVDPMCTPRGKEPQP